MRRLDIIVVIAILILSGGFYLINDLINNEKYDYNFAKITVDGKIYKTIELNDDNYYEKIVIQKKAYKNVIEIKGKTVRMLESNCRDKVCIKMGMIDEPGEIIVCLPNKIVIEIVGNQKRDIDGLAY